MLSYVEVARVDEGRVLVVSLVEIPEGDVVLQLVNGCII